MWLTSVRVQYTFHQPSLVNLPLLDQLHVSITK